MKHAIHRGGGRVLNYPVDQFGLPARLSQSIPMDCSDRPIADLECCAMRVEAEPEIPFPEVAIPAVVVSTDHHDGHSTPKPGECRGHVKAASGDDPGVGKPEIEEIAVDQQTIAQPRHRVEELEQCLLGTR